MTITERVIIRALIARMAAAGFQVAAVWDGEAYQMRSGERIQSIEPGDNLLEGPLAYPLTEEEALAAIASVDESTLHFSKDGAECWGNRGVLLILGNNEDIMSDYHDDEGPFAEVIESLYTSIEEGALG